MESFGDASLTVLVRAVLASPQCRVGAQSCNRLWNIYAGSQVLSLEILKELIISELFLTPEALLEIVHYLKFFYIGYLYTL